MCDYSLHSVKSRLRKLAISLSRATLARAPEGFAASEDATVAVCVLPGTELAFARRLSAYRLDYGLWHAHSDQAQDSDLSANQQRQKWRPSRCAGISRRPDRAPDIPE